MKKNSTIKLLMKKQLYCVRSRWKRAAPLQFSMRLAIISLQRRFAMVLGRSSKPMKAEENTYLNLQARLPMQGSSRPAKLAELTPREHAVLAQIVAGASSKEAARGLGISPRTVEFHRANILQKLKAKNTAELVRIVVNNVGT